MRLIKVLAAFIIVTLLLVSIDSFSLSGLSENNAESSLVDQNVFPHNEVINVLITIDEADYQEMLANPVAEEYYTANIDYNGYSFSDIGVRTKGNSSLRSVANMDSDRYSLKLNLDYYIDDQNFYGVKEINLNNLYADPTMMSEYIGYEIMEELDANAPRTTYAALYINGEYFGLYLCVEEVDESFLLDRYGNASGELYKPYMGAGCDLSYTSDNGADYPGLVDKLDNNSNNSDLVELIKTIDNNGNLDEVMNVDSFLKYLAMSSATIHLDAYQGSMFHNYYLYNNNGKFEWITWDLNMIFNNFPKGPSEPEVFDFLIDEPVLGNMNQYPLIEAIFANDEYVERYHSYLQQLIDGYLSEENINNKVLEIYDLINGYVKTDPTSFYSYTEFEESLFTDQANNVSLLTFIKNRNDSIIQQLAGEKASTNNGAGNVSSRGNKNDIGMGAPQETKQTMKQGIQQTTNQGIKQITAQGEQPPTGQGMELFQFDNEGNVILPDGVTLDDIPEGVRTYLERGDIPPVEVIKQNINDMPPQIMPQKEGTELDKQNGQPGGMKPDKQNGQQPGGRPNMGGFNLQFDDEGNVILPDGISMDDIPENIREYLERGEMPPRELFEEFLNNLPEELRTKLTGIEPNEENPNGKQPGMNQKGTNDDQQVDTQSIIPNLIILGVGIIGMFGFAIYLKRK